MSRAMNPLGLSAPRRLVLALLLLACALAPAPAAAFGFPDVAAKARKLASEDYKVPDNKIPDTLRALSPGRYHAIRPRPGRALWAGTNVGFEVSLLPRGMRFDQPVKINEVDLDGVRPLRFDPTMFDFGNLKLDQKKLRHLGFAGFRVHTPLNRKDRMDEVLSFVGASYFRALGKGQGYGLSARGLAIDTALRSGEEFPRFSEFWIARPVAGSKELIIYALLDSRRMTGAYRFVLRPGADTAMEVRARLYPRGEVAKLGIAPLTSMFFFGENQPPPAGDYRPEVHDSDGLSIQTGSGEWIWRPLVNPRRLLVTAFATTNPRGFGLMQRDRVFDNYQDADGRLESRPSAWVTPDGDWGAGRVELVQIPTPDESNDNIVAYWVPDNGIPKGKYLELAYDLDWQMSAETRPPLAWVMQTRRGRAPDEGSEGEIWLRVDFTGPALSSLPPEAPVKADFSMDGNGELIDMTVRRNDAVGGQRMIIRMRRHDETKPIEMRAQLRGVDKDGKPTLLSETWSYILPGE
ncbi:glucan biosynthesis protein G [Cognatazoarcus halotolerans]|uniref:glucan biosynthesis protein G n=1 Tax=Cognatazoarcus halotolerans TaxID=2686016 RepID=UPI00190F6CDF|nr:glucan biosynthesis protein G [Cognatazoarcus halotolerans]MCB1898563.1 glucan biosynthesis protein G [Rhodocyclaceae bacterium]